MRKHFSAVGFINPTIQLYPGTQMTGFARGGKPS